MIYVVDSAIQPLNNWGLEYKKDWLNLNPTSSHKISSREVTDMYTIDIIENYKQT